MHMPSRKILAVAVLSLVLALAGQAQQSKPGSTHLKVGDAAPDFTLRDQDNRAVKLSDFKGKNNVVLAFYVLAFTGG